jgi:hypothetical protein
VKSILTQDLAARHRFRKRDEQHDMHHLYPFERFVMNGGVPADVYERIENGPATAAEPDPQGKSQTPRELYAASSTTASRDSPSA